MTNEELVELKEKLSAIENSLLKILGNVGSDDVEPKTSFDDQDETKLPSAKLLLAAMQKENDLEVDKKKTLETRAGTFIAFSGAILAFFLKGIDLSLTSKINSSNAMLYVIILSLFYIAPVIALLYALFEFVRVISTREYMRLELDGVNDETAQEPEEKTAIRLATAYKDIVEANQKINNPKAKQFKRGIISISISIALFFVMFFISNSIK